MFDVSRFGDFIFVDVIIYSGSASNFGFRVRLIDQNNSTRVTMECKLEIGLAVRPRPQIGRSNEIRSASY